MVVMHLECLLINLFYYENSTLFAKDYIGPPFTGDHLDVKVIYTTRSHDWSTTRIKDLITRQTIKQNPDIIREIK